MEQIWLKRKNSLLFVPLMFFFVSCIDGYKDDWSFSSGVENATLDSPEAITFTKNAEGNILTITWSVVYGAIAYEFSLYDVTDPNNAIPIINKELVDGCSKQCNIEEDSNYKIEVRTIGNPKLNNKDALTATEETYSTMIPAITIPNGTDLFAFFTENGIIELVGEEGEELEVAYELEAGGTYTLTGEVDFDTHWLTLRGNKANRPKLIYDAEGRIATRAGLKIKFIDFDCSAMPAGTNNASFLLLSSSGSGSIARPIVIQSCNIKGLNRNFIYDNGRSYSPQYLLIQDCIIAFNSAERFIRFTDTSYANNLTLSNSTFYGLVNSTAYWIQYRNNARGTNTSVNITNCTFYNIANSGQMANYSGLNASSCLLTLRRNLFVGCGNKDVVRRLSAGSTSIQRDLLYNCYWYDADGDGEADFGPSEEMGHGQGDKSGTGFYENPFFTGNISDPDPDNVDFTPGAGAVGILLNRCGDPRWLP